MLKLLLFRLIEVLGISKATYEALKEMLRLAVFAGVSALITLFIDELTQTKDQNITFTILLLLLRWVDKWIHETKTGAFKKASGLLPF